MDAPNSLIVRPQIDAVNWDALASRMGIPVRWQSDFIWRVQNAIEAERLEALKPPEKPADRAEISADVAEILPSYQHDQAPRHRIDGNRTGDPEDRRGEL